MISGHLGVCDDYFRSLRVSAVLTAVAADTHAATEHTTVVDYCGNEATDNQYGPEKAEVVPAFIATEIVESVRQITKLPFLALILLLIHFGCILGLVQIMISLKSLLRIQQQSLLVSYVIHRSRRHTCRYFEVPVIANAGIRTIANIMCLFDTAGLANTDSCTPVEAVVDITVHDTPAHRWTAPPICLNEIYR